MNLKSIFSLCNATPERAFNARRQRKRFIHLFLREMGKKKKDKKKSCDRERYVSTSLTYSWQGSKPRVFRPIKHNNTARTIDKPIH